MRATAIIAMCTAVLALPAPSWAQMGSHTLRTQTRIVERAISRNLDRVFRPQLVVREGATGPVTALALSGDERYLVSAVGNNSVRLWDLNVGRELARLSGHSDKITFVAVSPDGKQAATGSADRTVRLWNLQKPGEAGVVTGFLGSVTGLSFLDARRLAVADATGAVTIVTEGGGAVKAQAHPPGPVKLVSLPGGGYGSGGADGTLRLWDGAGGKTAEIALGGAVLALATDGVNLAAGLDDGRVVLADINGGTMRSLSGHDGAVTGVAFGKDGALYSGGKDGRILAWAPGQDKPRPLGRHDAAVTFAAASKDGSFALSASEDGTTRLWNVATGAPLVTLLSTADGWAVVDPKGRYDGTQAALNGIDWQASDAAVNIEAYAETHYEAALLPRALQQDSLAEVAAIPDGVRYPARIRFVSPTVSGDAANPRVTVEVEAADDGGSGVSELRLYRNGRQLPVENAQIERAQADNGAARMVGRFELSLGEGRNVLTATAINDDRMESQPQTLVLNAAPGQGAAPPAVHVLTVGINQYRNKALNLDYARPDAQSLGRFFTGGRGAVTLGRTITLEDQQATRDNILAALTELRKAPAQDLVVVYMAGHGVSVGSDWYFVPYELDQADRADSLRAGGLSSKDLKTAVESLTADRTMLLLDTCHSGTAVSPLKDYKGLKSLRLLARSVGTHILAATDRNQYAVELAKLGHGVFTYALLDGLNGAADMDPRDGKVSAAEIIRYAEDRVPVLSKEFADYAQYPTGYSRGQDFAVSKAP